MAPAFLRFIGGSSSTARLARCCLRPPGSPCGSRMQAADCLSACSALSLSRPKMKLKQMIQCGSGARGLTTRDSNWRPACSAWWRPLRLLPVPEWIPRRHQLNPRRHRHHPAIRRHHRRQLMAQRAPAWMASPWNRILPPVHARRAPRSARCSIASWSYPGRADRTAHPGSNPPLPFRLFWTLVTRPTSRSPLWTTTLPCCLTFFVTRATTLSPSLALRASMLDISSAEIFVPFLIAADCPLVEAAAAVELTALAAELAPASACAGKGSAPRLN